MKIIDLDISAFLSGDTKIEEIGLVYNPAIEMDWVYFNSQEQQFESYDDYPQEASDSACKVLRWIEEYGRDEVDGMTQTGLARANQLCNREMISEETIARMASFERHRQNAEINPEFEGTPWKDKGYVAWLGWGGDSGIAWAQRKLAQIKEEKLSSQCGCNVESKEQFSHSEIHARIKGQQIGCKGAHIMGNEWHPCETHEDYEKALEEIRREDDEGMIEGIIELLNQVEDIENRAKMAIDVLKDFDDEGVVYDYNVFLERIGFGGPDLDYLWDDTMELEELLEEGYVITEAREVVPSKIMKEYKDKFNDNKVTEEQFYKISSSPNEKSILDSDFKLRRFVYSIGVAGGPNLIPTSREFCRRMLGKRQLVFRLEDINMLSTQLNSEDSSKRIIPRPDGASVNIFLYAGGAQFGANCRHRWQEVFLEPGERVKNNKQIAEKEASLIMDAPGQAGQQNEGVQYGRKRNPVVLEEESTGEFSMDYTPVGYIIGLPVYDVETYAKDKSIKMGCEGVYEEIEYMGKRCFRPCRSNNSHAFTNQEYSFKLDEEKRMIYAPAMIPNKLIRRYDENEGEYFVRFKKDSIERAAHKYLAEGRTTSEFVNYEHTDKKFDDIYLVESWIVGSDEDKIYDYGYSREDVPEGSWIVGYKVDNDELWNDYVKKGLIKAVSVEGLFDMSFNKEQTDEYLLSELINILNKIE